MSEFGIQMQAIGMWVSIWVIGGVIWALTTKRDLLASIVGSLYLCAIWSPVVMLILLLICVSIMWAFPL